jgi:hypothetical protein
MIYVGYNEIPTNSGDKVIYAAFASPLIAAAGIYLKVVVDEKLFRYRFQKRMRKY